MNKLWARLMRCSKDEQSYILCYLFGWFSNEKNNVAFKEALEAALDEFEKIRESK